MKKRWIVIAIIIIALLIAAMIFIIPMVKDTKPDSNTSKVEAPIENNDTDKPIEKPSNLPTTTPSAPVEVPKQVQEVITNNESELYTDTSNLLASGYPKELIPLYGATTVSESQLVTSATGKPGWLTSFVSEKSTEEIATFYRSLLGSLPDYSEEMISESTNFTATSGAYSINITISPNIQEKTDLPGQSAASIFIEQIQ